MKNSRICGFQPKPQPVSLICPHPTPHRTTHTPTWSPHPAHPHSIHTLCKQMPLWPGVPRRIGLGRSSCSPGSGLVATCTGHSGVVGTQSGRCPRPTGSSVCGQKPGQRRTRGTQASVWSPQHDTASPGHGLLILEQGTWVLHSLSFLLFSASDSGI